MNSSPFTVIFGVERGREIVSNSNIGDVVWAKGLAKCHCGADRCKRGKVVELFFFSRDVSTGS